MKSRLAILISIALILAGCGAIGLAQESEFVSDYENKEEEYVNVYTSSAELVFKSLDEEMGTIDFFDIGSMNTVTLNYSGATVINDRYGQPMSIKQLNEGDIVDIAYNGEMASVGAIILSPNAFSLDDVSKYSISENAQTLNIGDNSYNLSNNLKVFSNGQLIEVSQLINHDNLVMQGIDNTIFTIRVSDGHGYLELVNEDALIGGWIEVGQTLISQIMDGMLFTIPEGDYTVKLTNEGIDETREVSISRNEITTLDLSDIVSKVPEKGIVRFNIIPDTADTYVDGNYINTAFGVKLPVGFHEITASATGYATVTEYFEVTGLNQTVEINLEDETNEQLFSTVSGNKISKNLYTTLTIDNPVGAEVYEDNIYKGITPVTYQKMAGTHTLTFRKSGYVTTSYTVSIEDDGIDETLSFPDMVLENLSQTDKSDDNSNSGTTVSGNTVSGNSINRSSVSGNSVSGNSVK